MERKTLSSEMFEFCSDAWLDRAREILEELVVQAGASLKGQKVTGCEIFTSPPHHLSQNGENKTFWFFEVAEGKAIVRRELRHDVDFKVEVDYAKTLPKARALYPEPREPLPPLKKLFLELHNRLARITA